MFESDSHVESTPSGVRVQRVRDEPGGERFILAIAATSRIWLLVLPPSRSIRVSISRRIALGAPSGDVLRDRSVSPHAPALFLAEPGLCPTRSSTSVVTKSELPAVDWWSVRVSSGGKAWPGKRFAR